MDTITGYLLGLLFLLLLVSGSMAFVSESLRRILVELCDGEHRARFWLRLYGICLFFLVFFFALFAPIDLDAERMQLADFINMLRVGVFGLLLGLSVLGISMMMAVSRYERCRERTQVVEQTDS